MDDAKASEERWQHEHDREQSLEARAEARRMRDEVPGHA